MYIVVNSTVMPAMSLYTGLLHAEFAGLVRSQPPALPGVEPDSIQQQPTKKHCSLFAHYKSASTSTVGRGVRSIEQQLSSYLERINNPEFDSDGFSFCKVPEYEALQPLFEKVFCAPSTSAPVERVFSQSGLIMRPHRARMSDSLLETLMFLKCNSDL